jgi:hypothetical protein
MNLAAILELARKHIGKGEMVSSAQSCLADAEAWVKKENNYLAAYSGLRSLAYSVGILHADYVAAFKVSGYAGEPRLISPTSPRLPVKTYEIWLDFMTYPTPGESKRVRKMFTQDAADMYQAIEIAKATHGGKLWLARETAESQARS